MLIFQYEYYRFFNKAFSKDILQHISKQFHNITKLKRNREKVDITNGKRSKKETKVYK